MLLSRVLGRSLSNPPFLSSLSGDSRHHVPDCSLRASARRSTRSSQCRALMSNISRGQNVLIVASVAHRVAEDLLGAAKDGSVNVLIVASVAHRVAEDVLGAAKDGSARVLIVAQDLTFHRGKRRSSRGGGRVGRREGREREGVHGAGHGLLGPGRRAPSSPRHHHRRSCLCTAGDTLRWGRNWAAQWCLARTLGRRFRGCRAKRLYVHIPNLFCRTPKRAVGCVLYGTIMYVL